MWSAQITKLFVRKKESMNEEVYVNKNGSESLPAEGMKQFGDHRLHVVVQTIWKRSYFQKRSFLVLAERSFKAVRL